MFANVTWILRQRIWLSTAMISWSLFPPVMDENNDPSCQAVSDSSDLHIRPSCISSEITSSTRGGNASQIRTSAGKHGPNSSERLQLGKTEIIKRHRGHQSSMKWSKMQKWQRTIFCPFSVPYRDEISKKSATVARENQRTRREGFIQPSHSEQNRYIE